MKRKSILFTISLALMISSVHICLAAPRRTLSVKPIQATSIKSPYHGKVVSTTWLPAAKNTPRKKAPSTRILSKKSNLLKINNAVSGMKIQTVKVGKDQFKRIHIPGAGRTTRVGTPELPVIKKSIHIPFGQTAVIKNVKSTAKILSNYKLYPVQPQPEDSVKYKRPSFKLNKGAYISRTWSPDKIVKVGRPVIVRGQQIATVYIYPVQYNAAAKKVRVHSNITYDVVFTGKPDAKRIAAASKKFSPAFTTPLMKSVINFKAPNPAKYVIKPPVNIGQLEVLKGCDYLIITDDSFYNSLTPLVNHKTSKGLLVKRIKRSAIGQNPTAEQIRTYIRNYYRFKTPAPTYVLLVGDANIIPPHYKTDHPRDSELRKKMGTDLYYGCVDGNDMIPDIFVGRFPAKTNAEVSAMVAKTIDFENAIAVDAPWTRKKLLAAYFQDDDANGQADRAFLQTVERIYNFYKNRKTEGNNAFSLTRVYQDTAGSPANKTYIDGSNVANDVVFSGNPTQAVMNSLNGNVGFVIHRDHGGSRNGPGGFSDGWAEPQFRTNHVANLTNTKPAVYYSINCRTGWFDGETDKDTGGAIVDCLAEALLKRPSPRGAVAVIGSTRNSPSFPNNDLTLGLVEAAYPGIIPQSGINPQHDVIYNLGPALVFAKNYVRQVWGGFGEADVVREYEMYNVLGDPDLQIRYKKPKFADLKLELYKPWLPKLLKKPDHPSLKAVRIKPDAYKRVPQVMPQPKILKPIR